MWLDFRGHYFVRRKFWIDDFFPAREAQELENNPTLNDHVQEPAEEQTNQPAVQDTTL
jgi:hypothetical protein